MFGKKKGEVTGGKESYMHITKKFLICTLQLLLERINQERLNRSGSSSTHEGGEKCIKGFDQKI
jgi:hypothetical protein